MYTHTYALHIFYTRKTWIALNFGNSLLKKESFELSLELMKTNEQTILKKKVNKTGVRRLEI